MYIVKTYPNTQAVVYAPLDFPKEIKEYLDSLTKIKDGYDISGDRDIQIFDNEKDISVKW